MSLLDDARRLADYAEVRFDERGYPVCSGVLGCGRVPGAPWTPEADFYGHTSECSAVAVLKIVAALEAAERAMTYTSDELTIRHARECDVLWKRDGVCTCGLSDFVAVMEST